MFCSLFFAIKDHLIDGSSIFDDIPVMGQNKDSEGQEEQDTKQHQDKFNDHMNIYFKLSLRDCFD